MSSSPNQPVVCKNCGNLYAGKYCNVCGEKQVTDHDKSILHFFEGAFHFITHFEGTFFNTLKAVLRKPGRLSLDYCNGIRKKYFSPLPFFMLLVVLYLIFPVYVGLNMPLKNYFMYSGTYITQKISAKTQMDPEAVRLQANEAALKQGIVTNEQAKQWFVYNYTDSLLNANPKMAELSEKYNRKSEKTSKLLLLLLIPLTALPIYLGSFRKRKYFYDSLVLATEFNAFYLLFSFFILPLFMKLFFMIGSGWFNVTDFGVTVFGYIIIGLFWAIGIRRFFKFPIWQSILYAALLTIAHYYIVQVIYRTVLFMITYWLST